jgi:hypothetical protein
MKHPENFRDLKKETDNLKKGMTVKLFQSSLFQSYFFSAEYSTS